MSAAIDLDAYLRRIGHRGAVAPDLPTLQALTTMHAAAIPFENLDPLRGVPVRLESTALERKLLHEQRGGYCFEQNLLLAAALREVGFEVQGLIARVLWNQPEDAITAQTHMLLKVQVAAECWLADVGFGSMTLAGALRLVPGIAQPTALEPFRLLERGGEWRMQACVRGTWLTIYRFDLQPRDFIDYVVANHYVSTHPQSHFVDHLTVARTLPDRRLTLRDREFTVRRVDAEPVRRNLRDVAEIRQVLQEEFGLRVPDDALLERKLASLPS
ncbi:arylamine N-acetyltransferase [Rhodanobacter sp. DHG33]|uniref:arylamine N-acetyltransferase family protein n=1 Tax=Rhodanobacter sp. DHG33 TaxID=2775921 RepID=UPI0017809D09|nr:arylamine N-acetyltransferase [Rhodanobacter sp. DHG33]MBD8900146.1 arylamine N-acetyltransferase [Rhodanobacter sp. DHG33]